MMQNLWPSMPTKETFGYIFEIFSLIHILCKMHAITLNVFLTFRPLFH